MSRKLFILLSFVVLFVSVLDYKIIPFYSRLGLDFSNQYGFHHCQNDSQIVYKTPAVECPDFEARPYVYPPLLYVSYFWTRLFNSNDQAYAFFVFLYLVSFILIIYIWSNRSLISILFGIGLFFSFPSLFLLERGNSDLFITLSWSLGYFFYSRRKEWFSGAFLAFSVFSKLYPVYGIMILFGHIYKNFFKNINLVKSFTLSSLFFVLITPYLWFIYLVDVLPKWIKASLPVLNLAHSLKSLPVGGSLLFFLAVACWFIASLKVSREKIGFVWSGALALSTFNNGVSFDYNLVTFFPLALYLFDYLRESKSSLLKYLFVGTCFAILGSRYPFQNVESYPKFRLVFIAISMIAIPYLCFDVSFEFKKLLARFRFYLSRIRLPS